MKPLIGENPFSKPEPQMEEDYDSSVNIPQMVFLGLDARTADGLVWKEVYKGAPMWAVDVTPKGSTEKQATNLIKELESRGMSFFEGRMILSFPAPDGKATAVDSLDCC